MLLGIFFGQPAASQINQPADTLSNEGFLRAHPDLQFRLKGITELKAGKTENAAAYFRRSAYYGDKPSQAMIAALYWEGQGLATNRPLGYAWMDLAAERQYPDFLAQRERYWAALNDEEREEAINVGLKIYARYGDETALPRIATLLRRVSRQIAGSRTGFASNVRVIVPRSGSINSGDEADLIVIDGSQFYSAEFWEPERYRAWHDMQWKQPRVGRVVVGELHDATPSSRVRKTPAMPRKPLEK